MYLKRKESLSTITKERYQLEVFSRFEAQPRILRCGTDIKSQSERFPVNLLSLTTGSPRLTLSVKHNGAISAVGLIDSST